MNAARRRCSRERYDLSDRPAQGVTMLRGKAVQEGVRVRLPEGVSWQELAAMTPEQIRDKRLWPKGFLPLPHPNHAEGGMLFPKNHIDRIKEQEDRDLTRFDLDFDLPLIFLPEFPPPIYLTTRPDLGDVSQGQVIGLSNYFQIFNGILNPKQLEGLRLLLTPFPQQQFNATDDRRSLKPSQGVACFDCHLNGHSNGATHLVGDIRPQEFRHRLDTPSLRGVNIQRLFGSQRALKSVEDFTEFEQRAAYFDGDPVIATKKGVNVLERASQVHFMAEFQEIAGLPARPQAERLRPIGPEEGHRVRTARRGGLLRQGEMRRLPPRAVLYGQPDAQFAGGAVLRAADGQRPDGLGRRPDQDLRAPRHQGFAAVHARRAAADAGGHRRVLQPGAGNQVDRPREARPDGVHALPVDMPQCRRSSRLGEDHRLGEVAGEGRVGGKIDVLGAAGEVFGRAAGFLRQRRQSLFLQQPPAKQFPNGLLN